MQPTASIQAIPTTYKGVAFRSRLEARWAVFLDTLGIRWEYELRKVQLQTGLKYIPDFFLPRTDFWDQQQEPIWLEVKPDISFVQLWKTRPFARLAKHRGDPFNVEDYCIADSSFSLHKVFTRSPDETWFEEHAIMRTKKGRTWLRRDKPQYGKAVDLTAAIITARSARFSE